MWRTADGNSCQVRQSVSQERGLREKSHRFSHDFRRFRDQFSDPGCPKNRRKARRKRVFAEFLGFPQSPHPLLRLLRLLFFFLSFFPFPPRTETVICGLAERWQKVRLSRTIGGRRNDAFALICRLRRHLPPQRGRLSDALLISKRVLRTIRFWILTF